MDAPAPFPLPHQGGFPLVGDADGGDFLSGNARLAHRGAQSLNLGGKNISGIMLHPAGLGIMLRKFPGRRGHHVALQRKHHGPGRGGSLIQGHQIPLVHHGGLPPLFADFLSPVYQLWNRNASPFADSLLTAGAAFIIIQAWLRREQVALRAAPKESLRLVEGGGGPGGEYLPEPDTQRRHRPLR